MKLKTNKKLWLTLLVLLGIAMLLYPFIASKYNARHQSIVTSTYQEEMAQTDNSALEIARAEAQAYNEGLHNGSINGLDPINSGYNDQLGLSDIMGSIRIPSIGVDMPIYHGVSNQAMTAGAGHMSNTSLPIGGKSTHCVISSHSGLASHRGFTDLPDLQIGDLFYVDVLGETHCYKVTAIQTVLPHQVDTIKIIEGQDMFSLVTCVPICVNTHRLVVTGTRQPDQDKQQGSASAETVEPLPESSGQQNQNTLIIIGAGVGMMVAIPATIFIMKRCK